MENKIYYTYLNLPPKITFLDELPLNIIEYSINKYGEENALQSLYAYYVLFKLTNANLSSITFNKNGKPIIEGLNFTLSHSDKVVAVAFTNTNANIGIDVEKIDKKRDVTKLKKLFTNLKENDYYDFYLKWTQREAIIKAKGYSILERFDDEFKGLSLTVKGHHSNYIVSIYNNDNLQLEYIEL